MDNPPCDLELPGQPMDCSICSAAPLIASGLVDGQIVLHKYEPTDQQPSDSADVCSTSYRCTQVLARPSKKAASCRAVAFAADSTAVLAGFETGSILQLDSATGKVLTRMTKVHKAGINRMLAIEGQSASVVAGDDGGCLTVWDMRSQSAVYHYNKHTDFISGLTQHSKQKQQQDMLLAVSGDGTLSVHDLRAGKVLARSETDADDELLSVAVCKHGKKVVCGSQSGVLALWSWGYWNDCSDRFPGHPESVDALVKFDEDTLITGSSDGLLRVVNILPNKLIAVLGSHADDLPVERLVLSADRAVLASMSHDSSVKLWDLSILQEDDSARGAGSQDSGEWEEAGDSEEQEVGDVGTCAQQHAQQPMGATVRPAAEPDQQQQAGCGEQPQGQGDDDSDDSSSGTDSDTPQTNSKKRRRREKTAMRKGSGKPKAAGNFFSDLL